MEDQRQSSHIPSSKGSEGTVDPFPATTAKDCSGASVEPSVQLQTLLSDRSMSAQQPSCVSISQSMGPLSPSPLGFLPQLKAGATPDVLLDQGQSPALTHPSNKATLSDAGNELLGAAVTRGMSGLHSLGTDSGNEAVVSSSEPGSVFDSCSWMSQPHLIFGKQEGQLVSAEGTTDVRGHHQMDKVQLGTGGEQVTVEPAKSDPSSIDSSQEEDSLERLSPDSPFEVLTEMQEKPSCQEEPSKPLLTLDQHRVDLEEPKKSFFFTGGPLGETTSKVETAAAIGQKSDDLKTGVLPPTQPDLLEEIHDGQSKTKQDDIFRQSTITGGVSLSPTEVTVKSFQPSVPDSMSSSADCNSWDLTPQPQDKGKAVFDLEIILDQRPSDRTMEPVSIPGTGRQVPGKVCTELPTKTTPDNVVETSVRMTVSSAVGIRAPTVGNGRLVDPASMSSETLVEILARSPIDELWPLEEKAKVSSDQETSKLHEDSVSSQGASHAPVVETGAAVDCVQVETLENTGEADSSGESDDTVIEDLKAIPVRSPSEQKVVHGQKVMGDPSDLEKLVLVPIINVTESREEQVASDGEGDSISPVSRGAEECRRQSGDTKDSPVEAQGEAAGAPPQLGLAREEVVEQTKVAFEEIASSGSEASLSPSPPATDHPPFDEEKSAVEETGKHEPKPSSETSPVLSHVDHPHLEKPNPTPAVASTSQRLMDSPALVHCVHTGEISLVEGPSPLQEMIRRSAIHRDHTLGEMQPVSVTPAPVLVQTQSVIVRSTPIVNQTPSFTVKAAPGSAEPLKAAPGSAEPLKAAPGSAEPLKASPGSAVILDPMMSMDAESAFPVDLLVECASQAPRYPAVDLSQTSVKKIRAVSAPGEASDSRTLLPPGLTEAQGPAVEQEVAKASPSPKGAAGSLATEKDLAVVGGQSFDSPALGVKLQKELTKPPQTDRPEQAALGSIEKQEAVGSPVLPPARPTGTALPSGSNGRQEQRPRAPSEAVQVEMAASREASERLSTIAVKDLVYWRDPKKTGVVFGSILTLLVSLAVFSVVSVLAYLVLALLSVTISFRIYKSVIQAVQKTNDGNPFRAYLELDITLSAETFHKYCDTAFAHLNRILKYLLQLFLVQDLVDSLKLAVLMWLMTYVGAVFNGLTLLILAVLSSFSVPIVYETYQTQIDRYFDLAQKQVSCAVGKIQEKLPGTKRKGE